MAEITKVDETVEAPEKPKVKNGKVTETINGIKYVAVYKNDVLIKRSRKVK